MKERVWMLEGTLDISSREGEGTTVAVTVPIKKTGAE
jgi:signal transduction histidine kinase